MERQTRKPPITLAAKTPSMSAVLSAIETITKNNKRENPDAIDKAMK